MLSDRQIKEILETSKLISVAEITEITRLAGDASSKEFYRIKTNSLQYPRLILIKLVASEGPLSEGKRLTQDQSFINVGNYLNKNNFPIPSRFWHSEDFQYAIEEDLGDNILANYLSPNFDTEIKKSKFLAAIKLIPRIQNLKNDGNCIIFQREIAEKNYLEESLRFFNYTEQFNLTATEQKIINDFIQHIATEVSGHPQTIIFRDYTAWNILLDSDNQVRLVDFQDMLQGTYVYDLISIIHDRDSDLRLGDKTIKTLINQYKSITPNLPTEFDQHYSEALIQRHLRLAGQFLRLTEITGKTQYADWIPGCMYRLGRFMAKYPEAGEVNSILASYCQDFQKGFNQAFHI